ncbi:hypothetical protein [Lewinella sp. 4G2]|uniref:hypothetical protein n=1 Tax=Lewinella sp. 4G2 TaxID=1803372 RepID=UPI0007B4CDA2|nr:hypothetical protein [Lewinella sp. 4G2]OAV44698.1 hypothetical protein A3850_009430 [Lewinella sp. 4G2]
MALRGKIKRQIKRLERAANDDFTLILTGGAEAFATHELHQLLRRLKVNSTRLDKLRDFMFRVGLAIPFLMFAATALSLIGLRSMVGTCLIAMPVCVLVLALTQVHVSRNYACVRQQKRLRHIIQQELDRRRRGTESLVDMD